MDMQRSSRATGSHVARATSFSVIADFAMAACSAREVDRALQILGYLEEPVALDVYDAGYEWVRHMLLEAWVETKEDDRWKMGPFVDLLTSLKLRTGEPIQMAVPQVAI